MDAYIITGNAQNWVNARLNQHFLIFREDENYYMDILVTGVTGQLGYDVMVELARRGHMVWGTARRMSQELPELTETIGQETHAPVFRILILTDEAAVKAAVTELRPDAIIHCAAWTAVDAAEEPENREAVYGANVLATRYLAEAARDVGAKMVYISTDYVFSGEGTRPWLPDDKCFAPLNVYGQSKLDGELAVASVLEKFFIVRTAWVFGKNGKNFVRTMLNVGKTHDTARVVNDQIGTPTYTPDLARLLADMIETEKYGYYHATNSEVHPGEYISWYDFTKEIFRQAGLKTEVLPVSTEEYGLSKAKRPYNSRLDKSKLTEEGFSSLPAWKDALGRYLLEIGELADGTD